MSVPKTTRVLQMLRGLGLRSVLVDFNVVFLTFLVGIFMTRLCPALQPAATGGEEPRCFD
jgi:hypothetical protein